LAKGEISAKVTIEVTGASKSAIEAVEKAGGSVVVMAGKVEKVAKKSKNTKSKSDDTVSAKEAGTEEASDKGED
jgi:large subunit ribosomal protein L15